MSGSDHIQAVPVEGDPASPVRESRVANYANDSLPGESRIPAIPKANLGFVDVLGNEHDSPSCGTNSAVAADRNNESSPGEMCIELAYDADVLPELCAMEYNPEKDGEKVRFVPAPYSCATRTYVSLTVGGDDYVARYFEDRELTRQLIESQAEWSRDMLGRAEATIGRQVQLLERFFDYPFIVDPVLGLRPPTARELLQPDTGRLLVLHAKKALAEDFPEGVVIDFLNAVRRFGRSVCQNGAALPSGENVRKRWGVLACPIGDHEIPKRRPKSEIYLPSIDAMPSIFEAIRDWPGKERKQTTAWRTANLHILCFQSGMRGVEARRGCLNDQLFDRRLGVAGLRNPLNINGAKGGPARKVLVDEFGFDSLKFWLEHWRPRLVEDDLEGCFFPSGTGGQLSSSSLSETSKRLLDYLKGLGLLHGSFTFHSTRKTYTSHFLEKHGTEVGWLLEQCGWSSPAQLPTYTRPSSGPIAAQRQQFSRSLGRRSGRR